jgi:polyisoprenoid-binding protein YceI
MVRSQSFQEDVFMKFRRLSLLAALLLVTLAASAQSQYDIDPNHSTAEFAVKHLMITTVKGNFTKVTGTAMINDADLTKSSVDATIDANSVDTRVTARDNHLKSPDFFDVQKYPTITFKSTKVEKNGDKLKVTGDFTMHGVTKQVVLDVTGPSQEVNAMGGTRRAISATTKVNRRDYGINYGKATDNVVVVSDEVNIDLEIELVKKK